MMCLLIIMTKQLSVQIDSLILRRLWILADGEGGRERCV